MGFEVKPKNGHAQVPLKLTLRSAFISFLSTQIQASTHVPCSKIHNTIQTKHQIGRRIPINSQRKVDTEEKNLFDQLISKIS